jgi:membrane fusion protein (multidrug efflux system)
MPLQDLSNRKIYLGFSVFLVLGSLIVSGCRSQAQSKTQGAPAPTVEITEVVQHDTPIYSEYPGQTYARSLVEVRGRVDGYIEKWLFHPGQKVKAGQPLYVLDLRPYKAHVQQAQGALRQAEADLTFAQEQTSVLQAEANLATSKANLIKAQQDYERFKPLVEQDAAARQELEASVAALRAAEATVRSSEANLKQVMVNTQTQVQSSEGKVQAQIGALQTAKLNLQYGTISAPVSGLIGDTLVPVGGLVNANSSQPLTTIAPLNPIWVRFKISESQYLEFQRSTGNASKPPTVPLQLILADNSVFPHAGHIENALNQVDSKTGTLEVQAQFPNPEEVVLPGQFGRVRFVSQQRANAILVPQRAVQQNQSIQTVYVVGDGNKVQARPIKTGPRVGDDWIVEQGLKPGEKVIVEGLLSVRPGAVVNPVPYTAQK